MVGGGGDRARGCGPGHLFPAAPRRRAAPAGAGQLGRVRTVMALAAAKAVRARALGASWLGLCAFGCGEAEHERGSVMLAISTDMYVDKDLSRVDIIVQPEKGQAQSQQVNLLPALEGRYLPGTFSIIE